MRKATIILFLGIAVAAVASVSTLKWKSTMMDLGTVKAGEVKALEFEFTNVSDAPIHILQAQGSCGCTVVEYPKSEIGAGETAYIKANFRSSKPGVFNKTIKIKTSESDEYTYLRFKGEVVE